MTSYLYTRSWPEATSVSASQVLGVGTARFQGTGAVAVHVRTAGAATPCCTASCVNAHRASLEQRVR